MKRKKIFASMLIICLAVTMLAGCGENAKKTSSGIAVSKPNEMPITEEVVELDIFVPKSTFIENFQTNEFTKWYEKETNVKLNWEIASGDAKQALNLKLASGEYPDIILGFGFTKGQQLIYGEEQGILLNIKDYIDEHGHYIKEMFESRPDILEDITINGGIYGLPKVEESPYAIYPYCMWVYQPWMEKLDAEIPTTTDEFYELLKRFRDEDPNGNGKKDEIPMLARGIAGNAGIESYIMNSFVSDGTDRLSMVDGKVFFSADTDEYRAGLRYLRKLYEEGLFYRDSFVADRTALTSIGENDTPILGAGAGLWAGYFTINGSDSKRIWDFVSVPPLKGPDGFVQSVEANTDYGDSVAFVVTNACENPEIAVKWIDWFYNEENRIKAHNKQGFRKANDGEKGIDGEQALWAQDPVESGSAGVGAIQNKGWTNFGVYYKPLEMDLKTALNDEYTRVVSSNRYVAYKQHLEYGKDVSLPSLLMSSEDAALYADYKTTINNLVDNAFAEFVTGIRNIDSDKEWNAYVKSLDNAGLKDYLKIIKKYAEK